MVLLPRFACGIWYLSDLHFHRVDGGYSENPLVVIFFRCVIAINTMLSMTLHVYVLRKLMKPELKRQRYALTPLFFIIPAARQEQDRRCDDLQ
jgi:hypothetical protein